MSDHLPVVMTLETNKQFESFGGTDFEASQTALKLKNTLVAETLTFSVAADVTYPMTVSIYNVLGQEVKIHTLRGEGSLNIDVSALANGVYYVKNSVSDATLKFIKTR